MARKSDATSAFDRTATVDSPIYKQALYPRVVETNIYDLAI